MTRSALPLLVLLLSLPLGARAQVVLTLDGAVPDGDETHFFVPFEVPADIVEIEIAHDDLSADNILDWGVENPAGFRGWGGGNTEPAVIGVDRASRSYVPGPITPGTWRVVVGKAKIVAEPAMYQLRVTLRTAAQATLAAQPERAPYADPGALATGRRFYAGDFHVHSRESGDAGPTLDAIATAARARGLDFVVITDHNTHTALDYMNDAQARHPELLFIPGVELRGTRTPSAPPSGWTTASASRAPPSRTRPRPTAHRARSSPSTTRRSRWVTCASAAPGSTRSPTRP